METNVPNSQLANTAISSSVNYVPIATDNDASECVILNNTGVSIDVRQDNGGVAGAASYVCKDGTFYIIEGICNLNQVMVKLDSVGAAVTLQSRYTN